MSKTKWSVGKRRNISSHDRGVYTSKPKPQYDPNHVQGVRRPVTPGELNHLLKDPGFLRKHDMEHSPTPGWSRPPPVVRRVRGPFRVIRGGEAHYDPARPSEGVQTPVADWERAARCVVCSSPLWGTVKHLDASAQRPAGQAHMMCEVEDGQGIMKRIRSFLRRRSS